MPTGENRLKISKDKRILNEFATKIINEERRDKIIDSRGRSNRLSPFTDTLFRCECDDPECTDSIQIPPEEYAKVHHRTNQFIVVPSHVKLDLEEIVISLPSFVVVEKYFPNSKPK